MVFGLGPLLSLSRDQSVGILESSSIPALGVHACLLISFIYTKALSRVRFDEFLNAPTTIKRTVGELWRGGILTDGRVASVYCKNNTH